MTRTHVIDNWLRETVAPAYDALKADPARAITIIQLRARLAAEHEKALAEKAARRAGRVFVAPLEARVESRAQAAHLDAPPAVLVNTVAEDDHSG